MQPKALFAALFAVLLVGSMIGMAAPALGQQGGSTFISGEPRLDVHLPDSTVDPGGTSAVELQISNDGRVNFGNAPERSIVTTARNVRVEAEAERGAPFEIETGRQAIGSVTEDAPGTAPIELTVPEDAEPGTYDIDVEMRYRHVSQLSERGRVTSERSRTVTRTVEVMIDDGPQFSIEGENTAAQIGDRGTASFEIENIGSETADDVRLTMESLSSKITFGATTQESARAGTLQPGESTTLTYDVAVDGDASIREFSFDGTVEFTDTDGVRGTDTGLTAGVQPEAKQRFVIEDVESTLRVGEDGDLHGTVRNQGPLPAESVVVRYSDEFPNVVPIESDFAVGTLQPGESAAFRLPIEVSREAEAIPKAADMTVTYRNADNEIRRFEDVDAILDIGERRDEFLIDIDNREVEAGSSTLMNVQVTNNLDETVTDVEAKLFTDSPLSSDEDEGYTESLEPGETTTITFEVAADSGATPRTYPLQMDFRYDDDRGNSKVSDTYRTAIVVTESTDDDIPWLLVGAVVLVVVGAGVFLYRRREE
ncbi:MAG: COG1361 S-layer family protein [Natronomonas sp.]